jgi:GNAT superfamily N-acetyltransferase
MRGGKTVGDQHAQVIVDAIEANATAAFVRWGRLLGAAFPAEPGVTRVVTGLSFQFGNAVVQARLDAAHADERIRAIRANYARPDAPMAWLVGPSSAPVDLAVRLQAQGMALDDEAPGRALSLVDSVLDAPLPPGVTIAEVTDGVALARWIDTMVAGSELPESVHELLLGLLARRGFRRLPDVHYLLASEGAWPVATALLFLTPDVASVYNVATLLEASGRGIGTAVTVAALRAARELGHSLAVLQSSARGFPSIAAWASASIATSASTSASILLRLASY